MKTFTEMRYDLKELHSAQRGALMKFQHNFSDLPHVCQQIEELLTPDNVTMSAWWGYQWGGSLHVTITGLDSFKDDTLVTLLEMLEAKFSVDFDSTDQPEYFTRIFTADVTWELGKMDIRVETRVKNNSSGCHRIQIGENTTTVTTPIYRLECQGEERVD